MNKELTPLEALRRLRDYENLPSRNPVLYLLEQENLPTYYKIIETALKEYEQIEYHNLKVRDFDKKLKALEIIKEKMVDFDELNDAIYEDNYHQNNEHNAIDIYNQNRFEYKQLTQEEFDLLKEVLL